MEHATFSTLNRRLSPASTKKAALPRIRLHDLRHTYATLALGAGVHPKIVSERLGHANIGITLDCYSHCLPALSEEAACRVAALVVPGVRPGTGSPKVYTEGPQGNPDRTRFPDL